MLACLFCFSPYVCNILNNGELVLVVILIQSSYPLSPKLSLRYHIGLLLYYPCLGVVISSAFVFFFVAMLLLFVFML